MALRDISISWKDGKTISNSDAIMEQLEISIFTNPDEFSADPDFGFGIERYLAEVNDALSAKVMRQNLVAYINQNFPELAINRIETIKEDGTMRIYLEVTILQFNQRRTIDRTIDIGS